MISHYYKTLHRAIELLTTGQSITSIALDVGYENMSAFIAMFKRCLGSTPTNYFN
ncbi:MAG: AraC family transcriptional regulator [Gammaproteobacteria bacterium]|nr:AraC family transcriptional regulator [Gammaproteobacteria bacterium]